MLTHPPVERAPAVDLADVVCDVNIARSLIGSPYDLTWSSVPTGISRVEATAALLTWNSEVDGEERSVVARASAYLVDIARLDDPLDALDHLDQETFSIAENALRSGDSILDMFDRTDDFSGDLVSQMIIVDLVAVEDAYRGQQLGPRLLTTMIDTVAGFGFEALVVLRAQPLQWKELTALELSRSRDKVASSYEAVGFAHFRDHIYWRHTANLGAESMEFTGAS